MPIGIERCGTWRWTPTGDRPAPTLVDPRACAVTLAPLGSSIGAAPAHDEVNTLPGFTSTSLFPRMFEASGIPLRDQVTRLVDLALARA